MNQQPMLPQTPPPSTTKASHIILIGIFAVAVAVIMAPQGKSPKFPMINSFVSFVKNWGPVVIPFIKSDEPELPPAPSNEQRAEFRNDMPDEMINGEPLRVPDVDGVVHLQHGEGW